MSEAEKSVQELMDALETLDLEHLTAFMEHPDRPWNSAGENEKEGTQQ